MHALSIPHDFHPVKEMSDSVVMLGNKKMYIVKKTDSGPARILIENTTTKCV